MRVSVSYFNPDSDFNFSLDRGASIFVNFYFDCDKMTDSEVGDLIAAIEHHLNEQHIVLSINLEVLYSVNEEGLSYFI